MLTIADIIPKDGELPFMPHNALHELRRIASQLYYEGLSVVQIWKNYPI
jgi:hypothetical protein